MRLTRKCKETLYTPEMYDFNIIDNQPVSNCDIINKLGQLEDIEEWLGMDLITFLKLLQYNSIYNLEYKRFENKKRVVFELDREHKPVFYVEGIVSRWYFKDYNKTWALTKSEEQELEDLLNKKDIEDAHREEMWEVRRDLEDEIH